MISKEKLWKNDYENLRRKKNKEILSLQIKLSDFVMITYNILERLGLSFRDIQTLYKLEREKYETDRKLYQARIKKQ